MATTLTPVHAQVYIIEELSDTFASASGDTVQFGDQPGRSSDVMAESSLVDSYGAYIDGNWVEPDTGRYDVTNPATEQVIASAPDAGVGQVEHAIGAARAAFDSGPWPTADPAERSRCLQQLSDALLARGEEIYALAQAEWG